MKDLYTANATCKGGRGGHVETDDKRVVFDLTPFTSTTGTNPEQLFACGYAACFGSAIDAIAKAEKIEVGEVTVHSTVTIHQDDNNSGYGLSVILDVSLPTVERSEAHRIVSKAHHVCPYSQATRGNIEVVLKVEGIALAQAA